MHLKSIELNGFKSFHSKKEIIIHNGITGVVGPNGSGKSNIVDAMRWVLGEQSSKNLRGGSMQDVISKGSATRPKKGYCEVSLVFDNEDGSVDAGFSEVCVKRKMYRSGESEYYINNGGCRLKDILELFRDTGIGKEGYSIIGQGKIAEILDSKPVQRRRVFDEAAGIMKYRVRKEEAERNLEKTNDNILRISDIISELETQLGPLELQMREAKDYIGLRERLKALEVNLFLYNYDKARERVEKTETQLLERDRELAGIEVFVAEIEENKARTRRGLSELQYDIDEHNSKMGELMQMQEKLKGELALNSEKEKHIKNSQSDNEQSVLSKREAIEANAVKREEFGARVEECDKLIAANAARLAELRERALRVEGEKDGGAGEIEGAKRELERVRTELEALRLGYNENLVKARMIEEQRENVRLGMQARETALRDMEKDAGELEKGLDAQMGECEALRKKLNDIAQNMQLKQNEEEQIAKSIRDVTRKLDEDNSKYKLLKEMRDEHEGYMGSVRGLLKAAEREPSIGNKITGALAELIDVPKKYELPIETILGNALQNIVVETDGDAKDIIEFLRRNELGRITFLPTKSLKVRKLEVGERELLSMSGVVGVASELVKCDETVRPAVDFLLARTVLVDDMDSAIALMRKCSYSFRTLTMQGDFIKPGGVITGGSIKQKNTGLLSRKRMADELLSVLKENEKEYDALSEKHGGIAKALDDLRRERQDCLALLREREIAAAEAKQKLIAAQERLSTESEAFNSMAAATGSSEEEHKKLSALAAGMESEIKELEAGQDAFSRKLAEAEARMSEGLRLHAELRDELMKLEIEQSERTNARMMFSNELNRLRAETASAEEAVNSVLSVNEELAEKLKLIKKRKFEINEELDDLITDSKNAGALVREKFEEREKLNALIDEYDRKAAESNRQRAELVEKKMQLESARQKAELTCENMQNRLWEDYELTYNNALELREENFAYQNSVREIENIKAEIRGMGSVNPNAIEDYARVKERYDNLVIQRDDLVRAGSDLQIVIDDLLSGMRASFKEKFAQINKNFKRVFGELFGGGKAELVLLDEDDIMECGVDIEANPPGKNVDNILLLSGGERALTAIALIFAMLLINPPPVCILDEIDAPLDEENQVRLADYLENMSRNVQFVVVTHRKPTMAICDTLYGIAMHEDGVSDIVSVRMDKAV